MDGFKQFSRTEKWSDDIKNLLKPYIDLQKFTDAQLEINKLKAELKALKSKNEKTEEELKNLRAAPERIVLV